MNNYVYKIALWFVFFVQTLFCSTSIVSAQDIVPNNGRREAIADDEPITSDERFVNGTGDDYDRYLFRRDRAGGRLNFSVDVTRYYSSLMKFDNQGFLTNASDLIARGLLPRLVRLTLRVYDVDHNSQYDGNQDGIADPELDYVYVNGKLVRTGSGEPWPLGSGNNTWSRPSIMIPVEYILFPQSPGTSSSPPRKKNIIHIEVDVPNTTYWAVECDWISLEIESRIRPLVLVRGFGASSGGIITGSPVETWQAFGDYMQRDGIPFHIAESIEKCGSLFANAEHIRNEVAAAKNRFGVQKVNLMGHSKGGLDSRAYLRFGDDVQNLVQLGTPNHGSGWTYIPSFCDPAGINLMPNWVANNFNYANGSLNHPLYGPERLAGTQVFHLISPNDSWVSAERATLPWLAVYDGDASRPTNRINNGAFNVDHAGLRTDPAVYRRAMLLIAPSVRTSGRESATMEASGTPPDSLAIVYATDGLLPALANPTTRAYLPLVGPAYFQGVFNQANAGFSLKSPSGKLYTPTSPEYNNDEGLITYEIPNAEKGTYDIQLKGDNAPAQYALRTYARSWLKLAVKPNKQQYAVREPVTITATLTTRSGGILPGKGMAFFNNGATRDSLQLYDDGAHSDGQANDGVYAGTYAGFTSAGFWPMMVRIQQGVEAIYQEIVIGVMSSSAEFTNVYSEIPLDKNADGFYDSLHVKVGIRVKTGSRFLVSGLLKDSQNKSVASASWFTAPNQTMSPGVYQVVLNFNGEAIGRNELNGPYVLDDLTMIDLANSTTVDSRGQAFSTRSYNVNSFTRPPIELNGPHKEIPVDIDGDGDIDFLDIQIPIKVNISRTYTINAELIDSLQNSLNWSDNQVRLATGNQTVTLRFDGQEINEKLSNGPYILTNLYFYSSDIAISFNNVLKTAPYLFSNFTGNFLSGIVRDRISNNPIADATIILKGAKLVTAKTDAKGNFLIGGLPNGQYTVQATIDNFCSSMIVSLRKPENTAAIELGLIPKKFSISAKRAVQICQGDSLLLAAPAGWESYRWSNGSTRTSLTIRTAGAYSLQTSLMGCNALSDTVTLGVTSITKPNITSDPQLVLTATPMADSYQWFKNDQPILGATSSTYAVTTSGTYAVKISLNGCFSTSDGLPLVITSLEPDPIGVEMTVSPNPANQMCKTCT